VAAPRPDRCDGGAARARARARPLHRREIGSRRAASPSGSSGPGRACLAAGGSEEK